MATTIGTDPELFLRDTRTGSVLSSVGLIGGTKKRPRVMEGMRDGFAVQEDNVMVEFNIPPCNNAVRFAQRVSNGLDWISNVVHTTLPNYTLDIGACSRLFDHEQLNNEQAQLFGCSPDFDAHKQGEPCPRIKPEELELEEGAWRFAGGHVHVGFDSTAPDFVSGAMADVFLGLPSVALDKQGKRRELYGTPGRYRPTEWGIEYRTLSNFWIWDENLATDIGARALCLAQLLEGPADFLQRVYAEIPWHDVRYAILTEHESKAADLLTYISNDLGVGGL